MRNHRLDVESRFKHHRHFVPGLIHLPAIDALDRQHVEDDVLPVNGHLGRRNSEHGDLRAVTHVREHFAKGGGVAGHLQSHVKAFVHAQLFLNIGNGVSARIYRQRDADLLGKLQAFRVYVGDDDMTRTGMTHHSGGHDSDRSRAGDQHVLAQNRE